MFIECFFFLLLLEKGTGRIVEGWKTEIKSGVQNDKVSRCDGKMCMWRYFFIGITIEA